MSDDDDSTPEQRLAALREFLHRRAASSAPMQDRERHGLLAALHPEEQARLADADLSELLEWLQHDLAETELRLAQHAPAARAEGRRRLQRRWGRLALVEDESAAIHHDALHDYMASSIGQPEYERRRGRSVVEEKLLTRLGQAHHERMSPISGRLPTPFAGDKTTERRVAFILGYAAANDAAGFDSEPHAKIDIVHSVRMGIASHFPAALNPITREDEVTIKRMVRLWATKPAGGRGRKKWDDIAAWLCSLGIDANPDRLRDAARWRRRSRGQEKGQ